ncbi:MAG: chorismate-binding protein, partial [Firmicutes bacterium]|nr:chorismate-binding protein [Bacillota bacterium]
MGLIHRLERRPDPKAVMEAWIDSPYAFILDGDGDFGRLSRYTFAGADPFLVLKTYGDSVEIRHPDGSVRRVQGNPWETLDTLTAKYRAAPIPGLPPLAAGGAVGYLAYDLYPFCQPAPMLTSPEPFLSPPDCYLGFYDVVLAWDHLDGSARLFSSGFTAAGDGGEERARRRLDEFLRALERGGPPCGGWEDEAGVVTPFARRGLVSNFTRPAYLEAVKKVKEYIAAGEVYQVNLSQRFTAPLTGSSFDLYRRLRSISPAPFSAFLR